MIDQKLGICLAASIMAHFALERGLQHLPKHVDMSPPQQVSVRVLEPEPPKEPEKPPEPKPPEPMPKTADIPKARPVHAPLVAAVAKDAPPPDHPAVQTSDSSEAPVFGVTMESTSQQGGTTVSVGNSLSPSAGSASAAPKPLAPPVAAFEATKLPLPQGRCFGKYTDEARAAGLEGTVVLDLTVDEKGRARDISVVQGLGQGLSEAAKRALQQCNFTPGEKDGKPVAVRIRGFKIEFVLQEH
ncbi:MAG TPA: TonB family protein [Kofleriaceae bacterium]|nr:TonB family protein [Kofleriaceae bacterium]